MKAIILAAGEGTRLRPHTEDRPKCMVEFQNKTIIDHIVETMNRSDVNNISIVSGYKSEVLQNHLKDKNIKFYYNSEYATTNMVSSLFTAESEMNDDVIISYADIIYKEEILNRLIQSKAGISVVVDKKWFDLWKIRMENPLDDAETMKIDGEGNIVELGKKPKSLDEIGGQYIGLIKIRKDLFPKVIEYYKNLDKEGRYDGKKFEQMYMTTFLQLMIDNLEKIKAVEISGGWIEIDSVEDLENYKASPEIATYFN